MYILTLLNYNYEFFLIYKYSIYIQKKKENKIII